MTLKKSIGLIFIVGVIFPIVESLVGKFFVPGTIEHVINRLPMNINNFQYTFVNIVIGTLIEEVIYRGGIQFILTKVTGLTFIPILIASVLFACMHYSQGPAIVVGYDLLTITIDGIFLGIIFSKTHNLLCSWAAHCLSDLVGWGILLILLNVIN